MDGVLNYAFQKILSNPAVYFAPVAMHGTHQFNHESACVPAGHGFVRSRFGGLESSGEQSPPLPLLEHSRVREHPNFVVWMRQLIPKSVLRDHFPITRRQFDKLAEYCWNQEYH